VSRGHESPLRAAQPDASVYTQCPQCQTLYRITAELLRAARGQVQCGRCARIFDALTFLVEDDAAEHAGHASAVDAQRTASGQAPTAADSEAARPAARIGAGAASDSSGDIPDQALEFSLPPEAIGRVFVEAPKVNLPEFPPVAILDDDDVVVLDEAAAEVEIEIPLSEEAPEPVADAGEEPFTSDAEQIARHFMSVSGEPALADESAGDESLMAVPDARSATGPQIRILESADATHIELVDAGEPANEDRVQSQPGPRLPAIAEPDAAEDASELGDTAVLRQRITRLGWTAGVAVLGAILLVQFVHYNRHELVRRPTIGPLLERVYASLGLELSPNWNLKAYEVRQWGAAATPGAQGTLRVRASVVNTADHAQPLPLLRLSLADLAGARVGVRDFEPREYLPGGTAAQRMLGAGRRVDAEVVIVDPGKDAVGFEIDVCLRDDEHRVHCANDPAPAG
jgi:predicted Zn finger-like uncharacterized protein